MDEEPTLSKRARRAAPLIASAIAVILVAGLVYLRAATPQLSAVIRSPEPPALSGYLAAYDFVTPLIGSAVVADAPEPSQRRFWVFRTTDGAKHWQMQFTGLAFVWQMDIRFTDPNHGVIVFYASSLIAYRTSDAGVHWQRLALPGGAYALTFAASDTGWILAWNEAGHSNHLFSTSDGGGTWKERVWPPGGVSLGHEVSGGLAFRPNGQGWVSAGGRPPVVYLTADGGATWEALPMSFPTDDFVAQLTLLPDHGVLAVLTDAFSNLIGFTSFDAGQTWRRIAGPPWPTRYFDFSFVDDAHWWATRYGLVFTTSDAGQTWHKVNVMPLLEDWNYQTSQVIDSRHAWSEMISMGNSMVTALAMTSDGGVHWTPVNVPRPG